MYRPLLTIAACGLLSVFQPCSSQESDSIPSDTAQIKPAIEAFVATSLMLDRNWKEANNSCVLLAGNLKMTMDGNRVLKTITCIELELSYWKFIDSIWVKNNDRFYVSNIWLLDKNKIRQSLSINLLTQLTDTWVEKNTGSTTERKWKSGPMLPATAIFSYGFNYKPSSTNYINVSLPAIKVGTLPLVKNLPKDLKIIETRNTYVVYIEYGVNVILNIEKKIANNVTVGNYTSFFVNQSSVKKYNVDSRTIVSYSPVRNLKLRIENKIVYDDKVSDRFQWKYDFQCGLSVSF